MRLDRSTIAVIGGSAILGVGAIGLPEAAKAADPSTLVLLFGMMILLGYLEASGCFELATDWVAKRCRGPYSLPAVVIGLSGVFSAFLVNDVVCPALTPIVLNLCRWLSRPFRRRSVV